MLSDVLFAYAGDGGPEEAVWPAEVDPIGLLERILVTELLDIGYFEGASEAVGAAQLLVVELGEDPDRWDMADSIAETATPAAYNRFTGTAAELLHVVNAA